MHLFEALATTTVGMAIMISLSINPNGFIGMVPGTIAMSVGISNRINAKRKEEELQEIKRLLEYLVENK